MHTMPSMSERTNIHKTAFFNEELKSEISPLPYSLLLDYSTFEFTTLSYPTQGWKTTTLQGLVFIPHKIDKEIQAIWDLKWQSHLGVWLVAAGTFKSSTIERPKTPSAYIFCETVIKMHLMHKLLYMNQAHSRVLRATSIFKRNI